MRRPGIEPGSFAWEAKILPLNHLRLLCFFLVSFWPFLGEVGRGKKEDVLVFVRLFYFHFDV